MSLFREKGGLFGSIVEKLSEREEDDDLASASSSNSYSCDESFDDDDGYSVEADGSPIRKISSGGGGGSNNESNSSPLSAKKPFSSSSAQASITNDTDDDDDDVRKRRGSGNHVVAAAARVRHHFHGGSVRRRNPSAIELSELERGSKRNGRSISPAVRRYTPSPSPNSGSNLQKTKINLFGRINRQQLNVLQQQFYTPRFRNGDITTNNNPKISYISSTKRTRPGCVRRFATLLLFGSIVCWVYIFLVTDLRRHRLHNRDRIPFDYNSNNLQNKEDPQVLEAIAKQQGDVQFQLERARKRRESLERKKRKKQKNPAPYTAGDIVHDAVDGVLSFLGLKSVSRNVEKLPPGCVRPDWQSYSFLNCNDIHEIDLVQVERLAKLKKSRKKSKNERTIGYLAAGLWRQVWLAQPRHDPFVSQQMHNQNNQTASNVINPVVLKVMKAEHDVDVRNFDRHRRDALVMERLTSSQNVVDIYGYCGNTVLTEYAGEDLYDVIYKDEQKHRAVTRKSSAGRLKLALDVAKGVQAMHEIKGGPIIHADLQAKQFLIDKNGNVKVNDFNRCRFMGHKKHHPDQKCKLRIPSAPGKNRSPEEYSEMELDEKLDVYSTANVLYGILTGTKPWDHMSARATKKAIKKGDKPIIDVSKIQNLQSTDAELERLIYKAYELDSDERISATELVEQITELLEQSQET